MPQSIHQLLRQKRLERNLSFEEVAQAIRIRQPFLQALEEGNFSALPSLVQARGFLRAYADYLGLDADALLASLGQSTYQQPAQKFRAAMHQPYEIPEVEAEDPFYSPPLQTPYTAKEIFEQVGNTLRQQRENLGLSLEEIEQQTLLRRHYLKALEEGDYNRLPSSMQGRGMLSNYAKFLGLDEEQLLLQFAEGVQQVFTEKQKTSAYKNTAALRTSAANPRPTMSLFQRLLSSDLLWAGIFSLLLVGFIGWGIYTIFIAQTAQQAANPRKPPSVAEVLLMTNTPSITPTQPTPTATQAGIFYPTIVVSIDVNQIQDIGGTPMGNPTVGNVQLNIISRMRTWMRITVDGEVQFEGRTQPGSVYAFSAVNQIEVLTGNAAALQIIYNKEDLGIMGYLNQVANRIYTAEGVIMPSPTITLTPTITPSPTATTRPPRTTPMATEQP